MDNWAVYAADAVRDVPKPAAFSVLIMLAREWQNHRREDFRGKTFADYTADGDDLYEDGDE